MFVVDIFTGLRESELIGLTWDCIDFQKKQIRVYRQLIRQSTTKDKRFVFEFTTLKNDRERIVTAPDAVLKIFRRQKLRQAEWRLKAGSSWQNPSDLVFTDEDGAHINYQSLYKALKRIVQQIGRPEVRVHDLRHTYATLSLQQWQEITQDIGADIVVLDMPLLDTRSKKDLAGTLIANIVLQLLSYVAETERDFIKQRQKEGIAAAKARGVRFGRLPVVKPDGYEECREQWQAGALSARAAGKRLGVAHTTFIGWVREEDKANVTRK